MAESRTSGKLKVLHVCPEVAPLSKVGGLADVASSLPVEQKRAGIDARIITCAFPNVLDRARELGFKPVYTRKTIRVALNWKVLSARLWKASIKGLIVYILENDDLFWNKKIYPEDLSGERSLPFFFLSYCGLELGKAINWHPRIIHCHDWGTSALACALKWHPVYKKMGPTLKTVLTIHNLAHQGMMEPALLNGTGLMEAFSMEGLEFYGSANLLKGSILASDRITTVSPTYAREICSPELGMGLDGVIRANRSKINGIINGIDTDTWDPSRDKLLPEVYKSSDISGKAAARKNLHDHLNWKDDGNPLFCNVGRLFRQKGLDIIIPALPELVETGAKFIFLGTGDRLFEEELHDLSRRYQESVAFLNLFDEALAHLLYAGSDFFLMPSLFEPCGLSQLIAMRYGTIPLVRNTGGLADTVSDLEQNDHGTGIVFKAYSSDALTGAVKRALACFRTSECHHRTVKNAMEGNYSWKRSAHEYIQLYRELI